MKIRHVFSTPDLDSAQAAMNAALEDFQGLQYQTRVASAYETFLAVKWADANPTGQGAWHDVPLAVQKLFVLFPQHELGRLKPELPIILTTGYSDQLAEGGTRGRPVILKPYRLETLAAALDQALGVEEK